MWERFGRIRCEPEPLRSFCRRFETIGRYATQPAIAPLDFPATAPTSYVHVGSPRPFHFVFQAAVLLMTVFCTSFPIQRASPIPSTAPGFHCFLCESVCVCVCVPICFVVEGIGFCCSRILFLGPLPGTRIFLIRYDFLCKQAATIISEFC